MDIGPPPFEVSNIVLRNVSRVWGKDKRIEPFFLAYFIHKLLGELPPDTIKAGRDWDINAYERGILQSAWGVFLAMHLGYCDLDFLKEFRIRVFNDAVAGI